jgi:hypothetical protein
MPRAGLAVVVDPGDVLVGQSPGATGLDAEPGQRLRVGGDLGPQQLHRDRLPKNRVGRPPHLAEPARGDLLAQPIPASEQMGNTRG